jgi:PKD repeat protein
MKRHAKLVGALSLFVILIGSLIIGREFNRAHEGDETVHDARVTAAVFQDIAAVAIDTAKPVAFDLPILARADGLSFSAKIEAPVRDPQSRWSNPAKVVEVQFPRNFSEAVCVHSGEADVRATPLGANENSRAETQDDGSLIYRDAFPGCDVQYKSSLYKTEEFIVVRDRSALTDPANETAEWSWQLDLGSGASALKPRLTPAHTIELCDGAGVPRLRINAPDGKDADGRLLRPGKELAYEIDRDRLTCRATLSGCAYPVVIDPTWSSTGTMNTARSGHKAILLNSGKVLVCLWQIDQLTELFDPNTGTWSQQGSLADRHPFGTATLLKDGSVIVAGGAITERFNPTTGSWSTILSPNEPRLEHAAILLDDETLFITGGANNVAELTSCEKFNAQSGTWSFTGSLIANQLFHPIIRLAGGDILIAGGQQNNGNSLSQRFSQSSSTWTLTGPLATPRSAHTLNRLPDGGALVAGGTDGLVGYSSCEIFSPLNNTWGAGPAMSGPRIGHASVVLPNGRILACGGRVSGFNAETSKTSEVFDPQKGTWTLTGEMMTGRGGHSATVLQSGKVLVTGGALPDMATCEVYDPTIVPAVTVSASPGAILSGQTVSFSSAVDNPDGDPVTYLWNFGDGATSTDANPTHTYTAEGIYLASVVMTATSQFSTTSIVNSNNATVQVFPVSNRPAARFTTSDVVGFAQVPLTFDATLSTDPQNAITSYTWNFGDGSPLGSGQVISRAYVAAGTYTVTLTITDGDGLPNSTTRQIVILPADQVGLFNSSIEYKVKWDRAKTDSDTLSVEANVNVGDAVIADGTPLAIEIVGQRFEATLDAKLRAKSVNDSWQVKANTRKQSVGEVSLKFKAKKASLGLGFNQAGAVGEGEVVTLEIPLRLEIAGRVFEVQLDSSFKFSKDGKKAVGEGEGP